jgi:hypothetical protein
MSKQYFDVSKIKLDENGRTALGEKCLSDVEVSVKPSAGGGWLDDWADWWNRNGGSCRNSWGCDEENNTASCSNVSECANASNAATCTNNGDCDYSSNFSQCSNTSC